MTQSNDIPIDPPVGSASQEEPGARQITHVTSDFQNIVISRHPLYGHQLVIDNDLQISESDKAYNVAMAAPLIKLPEFGSIVVLGGGDGGVMNEVIQSAQREQRALDQVTMVEIDPQVMALSQRYLSGLCGHAFEHPKANVIVGDAFEYIANARGLNGVIYDLTMDPLREDQSQQAFIEETIGYIARALNPGGVFSMQCCGELERDPITGVERQQLLNTIEATAAKHFTQIVFQSVMIPSYNELWTFMSARKLG